MATILIDKNVMMPMREGVQLATDVYRLNGAMPAPALITRTPYDKEQALAGNSFDIMRAVQAGYAVVVQDVRGRYASESTFDPMRNEANDGFDTFAWVAAQPWSNGAANGIEQESPVTIFVMGIDQWHTESAWPLPDTQYRPYYLHSGGGANSLRGDGVLSTEAPGTEPAEAYLYTPLRPVPTVGGQVILPGGNAMGPRDQRTVEARDDVLVDSTPALDRPVEVAGPIELRLFVSSSARDTDLTGKLVDVFPDGRAIILTEGILRAR